MAADDLVYTEKGGEAIPRFQGVPKVRVAAENILIGSAGIMFNPKIEYKSEDWISSFIEAQRSAGAGKRPGDFAAALHCKMRETFQPVESSPESGGWKDYKPGERLVTYVVAGYTKSFQQAYFFEVWAEVNRNGDRLVYPPPAEKRAPMYHIGEDRFWSRVESRTEPQYSEWVAIRTSIHPVVAASLPQMPGPLQEVAASCIGFVKVEAKFNPQKVGSGVFLCAIDRRARTSCAAVF